MCRQPVNYMQCIIRPRLGQEIKEMYINKNVNIRSFKPADFLQVFHWLLQNVSELNAVGNLKRCSMSKRIFKNFMRVVSEKLQDMKFSERVNMSKKRIFGSIAYCHKYKQLRG